MAPDSLSDHPMAGGEERDLVFLSYSQTDAVWAQRFQVMLAPLLRPRLSEDWETTDPHGVEHELHHSAGRDQGAQDWYRRKIAKQEEYAPDFYDRRRARRVL